MNKLKYIQTLGIKAKKASRELSLLTEEKKNSVLKHFYTNIKNNTNLILKANKIDITNSTKNKIKENLIDRSLLNKERIIAAITSSNGLA